MKTIAVLVDFSDRSEHAARYALRLAKKIKANILLYNAFLIPSDIPMAAAQVAWPVSEYEEIKADAEKTMHTFCSKLKHTLRDRPVPGAFLPAISCKCEEGPVVNNVTTLERDKDILLLVAGTHSTDELTTFVLGNNCRELIDETGLPLLLVPENAQPKHLDHIIFASDLNPNDIHYINAVAGLAQAYTADIGIVNVIPERGGDDKQHHSENAFMQEMVLKVGYKRIHFRNVRNSSIKKGIASAIANENPDLLVMVHRKSNLFDFFFKSSVTKKLPHIPLFRYLSIPIP